jgi:hypothetical protein
MSLIKELQALREQQQEMVKVTQAFDAAQKQLEPKFAAILDRTIKKYGLADRDRQLHLTVYLLFRAGCMAEGWDPHYKITHLCDGRDGSFVWIGGQEGCWVWAHKHNFGKVYAHHLDYTKKSKISPDVMLNFTTELTELSGLEVRITDNKIVSKSDIEIPRTEDDLITLHEGGRIACSGKKLHEGWDIADPWAIVQTKKNHYVIYYATNGHGFGYDKCIMPDKPIGDFYQWLGGKQAAQMLIPGNIAKILKAREP